MYQSLLVSLTLRAFKKQKYKHCSIRLHISLKSGDYNQLDSASLCCERNKTQLDRPLPLRTTWSNVYIRLLLTFHLWAQSAPMVILYNHFYQRKALFLCHEIIAPLFTYKMQEYDHMKLFLQMYSTAPVPNVYSTPAEACTTMVDSSLQKSLATAWIIIPYHMATAFPQRNSYLTCLRMKGSLDFYERTVLRWPWKRWWRWSAAFDGFKATVRLRNWYNSAKRQRTLFLVLDTEKFCNVTTPICSRNNEDQFTLQREASTFCEKR